MPEDNPKKPFLMDGFAYSRILIKWVRDLLQSEMKGLPVTNVKIADYLEVSHSMITRVESGERQFGTKFLTEFAKKQNQTLNDLLDELIEWARDCSEQSIGSNYSPSSQKQQCTIWDSKVSSDTVTGTTNPIISVKEVMADVTDAMMNYLRESINRSRNNPEDIAFRFDGDLGFRYLLTELGGVFDRVVPDRLIEAAIVFTSDNKHSSSPHAQVLSRDEATKLWEPRHVRNVHRNVVDAIQKAWLPSVHDTVFQPSWAPSDLQKDLVSPSVSECEQNSNVDVQQRLGLRIILPVHQQRLPSSSEGVMTTRTSLVLQFRFNDCDSHQDDHETVEYISKRFSEIAEFVCLAIVQDIVTTNIFTSRDLCVAATQLGSWGVVPAIEHAEAGIASVLDWLFDGNRIKGKKSSRNNSPTARGYEQLLAADVWFFDNWQWEFVSDPSLNLHKVSDRIGNSIPVIPSRGTAGRSVPYKEFYERHYELLRPRVPDGKSINCLSTSKFAVFDSSSDYIQPHPEVDELQIGTQVGIPFDVTVDESAYGVIRPAILWMRFARKLDQEESTAVITSVTRYIGTCKNLRARIRRQVERVTTKEIEAAIEWELTEID